jgi:hypothetical protein
MNRWGPAGPPDEAYSRVTDAERFRPLHEAALRQVAWIEREFFVTREDGFGLLPPPPGMTLARPSIRLAPALPAAASILLVFTTFPGILLRFGHCATETFPACGCDACDETAEEETERLREVIGCVVAGRFQERLGWRGADDRWEVWSERGRSGRGGIGTCAESLPRRLRRTTSWKPWPRAVAPEP